jgi:peroxiredoxin Q/BCP
MGLLSFFSSKVRVGHKAPDFTLLDQSGKQVRLADVLGKKVVVLYFYPKDNTYFCTAESISFRDHYNVFKEAGAELIGVSSDSVSSHAQFAGEHKLPFSLLSDAESRVRTLYGVPSTAGLIPGRVTYVIDLEGNVRHIINSQFHVSSHVDESLEFVNSLKTPTPAGSKANR